MGIGLAGALAGGVLTLLSPCSVMLLPAFFAYAFAAPGRLLARTWVFYLGLVATLVPLGVLAGGLGALISANRLLLTTIAAVVVIALGVLQLAGIGVPGIERAAALDASSTLSVFLLGTVYGLAGACAGPILGSALALAGLGGNPLYGGIVLAGFALGMVVPLFLLALAWERIPAVRALVRPRALRIGRWETTWTQLVTGLASIGLGILLLVTDGTTALGGVLGAADQAALETWSLGQAAGVPDLLLLGLAGIALGVVWYLHHRRARTQAAGARR